MSSNWKIRFALVLACVLLAGLFLLPSLPLYSQLPAWMHKILPDKQLKLGLDLQGGIHLVLEVDVEQIFIKEIDRLAADLKSAVEAWGPHPLVAARSGCVVFRYSRISYSRNTHLRPGL